MSSSLPLRAVLGFIAGALAVLVFHQGMIGLMYAMHMPGMAAPYSMAAVPPYGVPRVLDLCFWGGLYGAVFGILSPRFTWPLWLCGVITGIIAALVGMFVVAGIKGTPMGGGWMAAAWMRSFLINGSWGLGLGLIYPLLAMRGTHRAALR